MYKEYIGIYDEPYVQIFVKRITAINEKDAEETFLKYLEEVNGGTTHEVYIDLISNLEILP